MSACKECGGVGNYWLMPDGERVECSSCCGSGEEYDIHFGAQNQQVVPRKDAIEMSKKILENAELERREIAWVPTGIDHLDGNNYAAQPTPKPHRIVSYALSRIYIWLGLYRDLLPHRAVNDLQEILRDGMQQIYPAPTKPNALPEKQLPTVINTHDINCEANWIDYAKGHTTCACDRRLAERASALEDAVRAALDEAFCGCEPATTSDGCYTGSPAEAKMRAALRLSDAPPQA